MSPLSQTSLSRFALAIALVLGSGCVSVAAVVAQTLDSAPLDTGGQTDADMPHMDVQNVEPARQHLLGAIQQLRNDKQAGNQSAVAGDQMAVIDARAAMMDAQIQADQTRMPQAPADVQAMMQARDQVLRAEEALGTAQKKLIGDQQANNAGALREDVALVNAAQLQSQKARQQWVGVRVQTRDLMPPIDPQ